MRISVFFTPLAVNHGSIGGKPTLVVDVLRTNTSIITALANGARAVVPVETADEAMGVAQNLESDATVLAGELKGQRVEGFDIGSSPADMTAELVQGKTIVFASLNAAAAYHATGAARPVFVGAAVNFSAAAVRARADFDAAGELVIVCAGREKMFALEDAYAAGRFVQSLAAGRGRGAVEFNDAAIAARELVRRYGDRWRRAISASAAAKALKLAGFKGDVEIAVEADKYDIVPSYSNKLISLET
ncbi:MAG: 2-phosphosulfolactate phosphatase [Gemmatimonadales bacterium]